MECNWKVFVDNYLDGGYHVEHLHPALTDNLDISSYTTKVTNMYSMQDPLEMACRLMVPVTDISFSDASRGPLALQFPAPI